MDVPDHPTAKAASAGQVSGHPDAGDFPESCQERVHDYHPSALVDAPQEVQVARQMRRQPDERRKVDPQTAAQDVAAAKVVD